MSALAAERVDDAPRRAPAPVADRTALWLLAAAVVGLLARLYAVLRFPFEQDEVYTFLESRDLFHTTLKPGIDARPLYYLLEHPLIGRLPFTAPAMRVLPLLFGIAGAWLAWRAARDAFGARAAAIVALVVAVCPWQIYATGMARYWALVFLCATVVYWRIPIAYDEDRPRDYLTVLAALVVGTLTHPTFVFPMVGVALAVTLVGRDGAFRFRWPSATAWRALWGPYALMLLAEFVVLKLAHRTGAVQNWGGRGLLATLRLVPAMVDSMTLFAFACAVAGTVVLLRDERPGTRRLGAIVLLSGLSCIGALVLASLRTDVYADYGVAALPGVFLAIGGLAAAAVRAAPGGALPVSAALVAAGMGPAFASHMSDGSRFDYRGAYARAAHDAPGVAVLGWPKALKQAYAPHLRFYEIKPDTAFLSATLEREHDLWAVVSVKRYGIALDDRGQLRDWFAAHCRLTESYERPRLDYRLYRVDLMRCAAP